MRRTRTQRKIARDKAGVRRLSDMHQLLPPRVLTVFALATLALLASCTPGNVKPVPAVARDVQFDATILPALRVGAEEIQREIGGPTYTLGEVHELDAEWRMVRGSTGSLIGRAKAVDVLARQGEDCFVLHFDVMEEHDGRAFMNVYTARPRPSGEGTYIGERHPIACIDYR